MSRCAFHHEVPNDSLAARYQRGLELTRELEALASDSIRLDARDSTALVLEHP